MRTIYNPGDFILISVDLSVLPLARRVVADLGDEVRHCSPEQYEIDCGRSMNVGTPKIYVRRLDPNKNA